MTLGNLSSMGQTCFASTRTAASKPRGTHCTVSYIVVVQRAAWYGAARKLHMEAHLYALAMEVGSGVLFLDAQTQHVAKAAVTAVLGMVVASDANLKGVGRVLKGTQTSASGMVGEGGANLKDVQRVHKDGQISALGMVGAVGASSKDATRAQNGGRISVLFIGRVC